MNKKEKQKVLVIGQGSIGRRHSRVLSELGCDVEVVTRQGTTDYKQYESIFSIQDFSRFDYFVIAVETIRHHSILKKLDESLKKKTILVEKPIFEKLPSSMFLSGNNIVRVGYNLRFHPVILRVKELISGVKIFTINAQVGEYLPWWRPNTDYKKSYSANRDQGGGVLRDLSHEIDFIQWFLGPLTGINGISGTFSNLGLQSDDVCFLNAKTESGIAVSIAMDYLCLLPHRNLLINAEGFSLQADIKNGVLRLGYPDHSIKEDFFSISDRDISYREMHRSILSGTDSHCCTYEEAIAVLKTINSLELKKGERL